ncbi:MAG: hypothetical protein K0R80_135 [Clostridia bacterium]|jgi:protein gp37|nr:hypothetical protein [Clostridia bacterium]
MNKSKIEWCDYTWNPVTGCLHGCKYCYAERIANRFASKVYTKNKNNFAIDLKSDLHIPYKSNEGKIEPYPAGFQPTFHRYRLDEPKQKTKPSRIFVSSMGDLFGEWVPEDWIKQVFETVKQCPQHTFMFLTKNPKRYLALLATYGSGFFPTNALYGASADSKDMLYAARNVFYDIVDHNDEWGSNIKTFYSIEPLLEDMEDEFKYDHLKGQPFDWCDWVIVGAQTGLGAVAPKAEWVQHIIDACRHEGVPVFLKNNLNWPEQIQEYPEE